MQHDPESEFTAAGVCPGDILDGKYRIDRILGVGGMGVVVAAHHLHLDERVALKFLLPEARENPEVVARFAREARAAVRIKSEHVARVSDVGVLANGSPYMVMEYLDGTDLSVRLSQDGPHSVELTVEFVLQACEALAEAHVLGIVHRDLKPANLFCIRRSDGIQSIKVLDFGISKMANPSASDAHLTRTTAVFGSPLYMSPEQMLSARDVDARTDIWSLGTILYELLTGVSPFNGTTLSEVYARISSLPPASLRDHRPDVPVELELVILKCLEKNRNSRYVNVSELAHALRPFAPMRALSSIDRIARLLATAGYRGELDATVSAPVAVAAVTGPNGNTDAVWGHTASHSTKRRTRVIGTLVTVGLVATAAVVVMVMVRRVPSPVASPSVEPVSLSAAPAASLVAAVPQNLPESAASVQPAPTTTVPILAPPTALPPRNVPGAGRASRQAAKPTTSAPARPTQADLLNQQY